MYNNPTSMFILAMFRDTIIFYVLLTLLRINKSTGRQIQYRYSMS